MNCLKINELLFTADNINAGLEYDVIVILGSRDCEYRVRKALEINTKRYICSGGNNTSYKNLDGRCTIEADFLKNYLVNNGISESRIIVEKASNNSYENIINCWNYVHKNERAGIVTAGFHAARIGIILKQLGFDAKIIPAYGPHTSPDGWMLQDKGIEIICGELRKTFPGLAEDLISQNMLMP